MENRKGFLGMSPIENRCTRSKDLVQMRTSLWNVPSMSLVADHFENIK